MFTNEDMAVGASIAIERAGKTGQVSMVSGNGAPYGLDLIKQGKMALTNANPPSIASVMALRLLVDIIDKKLPPGNYYNAPTQLIDKSNVDTATRWDAPPEQIRVGCLCPYQLRSCRAGALTVGWARCVSIRAQAEPRCRFRISK